MDYPSYPGPNGAPGAPGAGITPEIMQALMAASSGQEDQQNMQQQMAMAQGMRQPMPESNDMAGRVAVKHNPMEYIGATMQNIMAQRQERDTLAEMRRNAIALRQARGKIQQGMLGGQQQQPNMMPSAMNGNDPSQMVQT